MLPYISLYFYNHYILYSLSSLKFLTRTSDFPRSLHLAVAQPASHPCFSSRAYTQVWLGSPICDASSTWQQTTAGEERLFRNLSIDILFTCRRWRAWRSVGRKLSHQLFASFRMKTYVITLSLTSCKRGANSYKHILSDCLNTSFASIILRIVFFNQICKYLLSFDAFSGKLQSGIPSPDGGIPADRQR